MDIILRAATEGIVDVGQLTKDERRKLNNAVRRGTLSRSTYYGFPMPKNAYVARLPWDKKQ